MAKPMPREMSKESFSQKAVNALHDVQLQKALHNIKDGLTQTRKEAMALLPEYEAIRQQCVQIKNHSLKYLDTYLEAYEKNVLQAGGHVHWAETDEQACEVIVKICRDAGAKKIVKGKSMVTEEIGLNPVLEQAGFEVTETDLGEYIIQLAGETPSHIIAPAIHKTKEQVADLFHDKHQHPDNQKKITERADLVADARKALRQKFIEADVGITGANFLVAETGQHVLVTNEGNGDLCSTLPGIQIVVTGIEKVVPTRNDVMPLLRLLTRSAVGQQISNYVSFFNGPKRAGELDGPTDFHVVLVDNGRSKILASELKEILRCVRCGACLNHCPVYGAVGGHTYDSMYSGPMGAVITPLLKGLEKTKDMPNACTLNGRCQFACPMDIPLPAMMRQLRNQQWESKLTTTRARWSTQLWGLICQRPKLYRFVTAVSIRMLSIFSGRKKQLKFAPFAGAWFQYRDLPTPESNSFMSRWKKSNAAKKRQAGE